MRGRTFGWYVRTPRSTRLLHLQRQHRHASYPCRYAKAPEATATGNQVFAGKVLKKGGLRSYTYFDFW